MSDRQTGYRLAKLGHELNAPARKKKNVKNYAKIVLRLEFSHFDGFFFIILLHLANLLCFALMDLFTFFFLVILILIAAILIHIATNSEHQISRS